MLKRSRLLAVLAASLAAVALVSTVAVGKPASHGTKDSGTSYISIVHQKGSTLYAAGYSFDKRFGQSAATYVTKVSTGTTGTVDIVVKRVVEYTSQGTLYGTASAVQNLATSAVTDGKLNLTHGTAGLKGHTFKGTFTGTYDTKSGIYTFNYKGTYK